MLKRKKLIILLLTLLVILPAFQKKTLNISFAAGQTEILKAELSKLNLNDPGKDVEKNMSLGDYRYMGVCDYTCYAPGVGRDDLPPFPKEYYLKVINGTSDVVEDEEHLELIETAAKYAEKYNKLLIEAFRKK